MRELPICTSHFALEVEAIDWLAVLGELAAAEGLAVEMTPFRRS